jgi:uncharacterized protein
LIEAIRTISSRQSSRLLKLALGFSLLAAVQISADTGPTPRIEVAAAQFEEGGNYFAGTGIAKDLTKARACFESASQTGHPKAKGALGYMLLQGLGGPKDEAAASRLLRAAADAGITSAQVNLGGIHEKGTGVPRNLSKAASLYEIAARSGSVDAHLRLMGIHYFGAEGMPVDYAKALPHVKAAALAGDARARNILGTMCEFGQAMKSSRFDAMHWFREAANQGDAKAQGNLGRMIRAGNMTEREIIEAYRWLKLAASRGDESARRHLAEHLSGMSPAQIESGNREVAVFGKSSSGGGES